MRLPMRSACFIGDCVILTAVGLVLRCQKLHDMKNAMRQLLDAVRADICFRTSDCQEQIQFVLDRSKS